VNRILARYKKEGMEAMVGKRHHHGNRYMSREEETAFLLQFQRRSEAGQIIETREIHQAYEKAVGHSVTRNMIYYLLHRHKWRKVMPRSRHEKKAGEEAIEAYKKNHRKDQNAEKEPAKTSGNVPGRSWVWTNQ
jgi:transposase